MFELILSLFILNALCYLTLFNDIVYFYYISKMILISVCFIQSFLLCTNLIIKLLIKLKHFKYTEFVNHVKLKLKI